MSSKAGNTNPGHVSIVGNGTGDFMPPISIGDNDSYPGMEGSYTTCTYPIVIITVHEKGTVSTYQLNADQIDVFLTNAQKKSLIKKIKLAKMVEKL